MDDLRLMSLQRMLPMLRDEGNLMEFLRTCDDTGLFLISTISGKLWKAVESVMTKGGTHEMGRTLIGHRNLTITPSSIFAIWPPELCVALTFHLELPDLKALATTCRFYHQECSRILYLHLRRCFGEIGLEWDSVRFMLRHTDTVFSGWFVHHVLFLHRRLGDRLDNWTIDLYVRAGTKATAAATFLALASDYYIHSVNDIGDPLVEKTVVMRRKSFPCTAPRITIHSCTEPSRVAVFRQSLTCNINWISSSGLFVAYPSMTYSSSTMISPEYVPLRDDQEVQKLVTLRRGAETHGIRLAIPHADGRSRCGVSDNCPSVVRSSLDEYAFHFAFDHTGWDREPHVLPRDTQITWTLGSLGCKLGRQGIPYAVNWFEPSVENHMDQLYLRRLHAGME
ncbi:hypothetical protein K438DRAFT_1766821 [Mycena galopus ATCC 62051]|nr:hypothetical protein K438DRAFT_1766821 [Mycena galopus ATCC 62051]